MKLNMIKANFVIEAAPGTMTDPPYGKGEREVATTCIEVLWYWDEEAPSVNHVKLIGHRIKKDGSPYNEVLDWHLYGQQKREWLDFIGFDMTVATRMVLDQIGERP